MNEKINNDTESSRTAKPPRFIWALYMEREVNDGIIGFSAGTKCIYYIYIYI